MVPRRALPEEGVRAKVAGLGDGAEALPVVLRGDGADAAARITGDDPAIGAKIYSLECAIQS